MTTQLTTAPAILTRISESTDCMRLMLLISNLEFGGAQRQVVELANHLDPARFEVHVACLSDYVPLADRLHDREHRLHIIQKHHKFDITVVPRLAKLLRRLRIDVLQSYLFDADIAARLAGRWAGTPVVIGTERNTDYHLKRRQLFAYALTKRWVHGMVANSSAGAAFNARVLKMDPSLYRVVHNGVNTERFQPRPDEGRRVRDEIGIGPVDQVVGMFGSFKEQKNQPLLLRAMQRVVRERPAVRLLLVGDMLAHGMHGSDDYKAGVDRLIDELGLRERCICLGNRNDVERVYCACDLTVLPSLFEGTPNVLLESMACGVPVVATNVSDNAYIVPDGEVGYVVPLGDEAQLADRILRLLTEDALRRRLGEQARAWVGREFSIPRLVEKTGAIFEQALAARSRGRGIHAEPRQA